MDIARMIGAQEALEPRFADGIAARVLVFERVGQALNSLAGLLCEVSGHGQVNGQRGRQYTYKICCAHFVLLPGGCRG